MRKQSLSGLTIVASLLASTAMAATPSFTADQASAGAADYAQNCAMCHGAALNGGGGPALTGSGFTSGSTVSEVFGTLAQQMPATNPGGLTHTQYEDLMAYILQKNGDAPGSAALSYDAALKDKSPLTAK